MKSPEDARLKVEQAARLKDARVRAGFTSARDAALRHQWNVNTYKAHESGRNGVGPADVARYAKAFRVDPAWILVGAGVGTRELTRVPSGQEFRPDPDFDASLTGTGFAKDVPFKPSLARGRPEIDAKAGAGHGSVGEHQVVAIAAGGTVTGHRVVGEWVIPDAVYRSELHAAPSAVFVMAVDGESMRPTLEPGDRIFVDGQRSAFTSDGIYLIDDGDGEPRVKRLEKVLFSQPPAVVVRSDNPGHGEQTVRLDALRVLGKVCGRLTRM